MSIDRGLDKVKNEANSSGNEAKRGGMQLSFTVLQAEESRAAGSRQPGTSNRS